MKITYERLVNLGNYNNERLSLEDDVQPDETPEQAYARLRALAHELLGVPDPKAPAPALSALGARSRCADCDQPIYHNGKHWTHEGDAQPRHPAIPVGERPF